MHKFPTPSVFQTSNCFFSIARLPHIDPAQPPRKGRPWNTLSRLEFIHKIDLILPQECLELINQKLLSHPAPEYKRVVMTLAEMLEGDFFREYIKTGNIMMLSEGRLGQDNVFTLTDGTLTMFLDRETYERAGLTGTPHGVKGNRGLKPRWVVEIDLREPWMWPGKKGFDRILYACRNVLTAKLTWLFCNPGKAPAPDPLAKHFPTNFTCRAAVAECISTVVPSFTLENHDLHSSLLDKDEFVTNFYEWLSLIRLQSPRIDPNDSIDLYLSRYQLPESGGSKPTDLCMISWQGFFSSSLATQILIDVITSLPNKSWFALSMTTLATSKALTSEDGNVVVVAPPIVGKDSRKCYLWEVRAHE